MFVTPISQTILTFRHGVFMLYVGFAFSVKKGGVPWQWH